METIENEVGRARRIIQQRHGIQPWNDPQVHERRANERANRLAEAALIRDFQSAQRTILAAERRYAAPLSRIAAAPRSSSMQVERIKKTSDVRLSGMAARYYDPHDAGTEYVVHDGGRARIVERIRRGAFAGVLAKPHDVIFCGNHVMDSAMARTTAGTLQLFETPRGLAFSARVSRANHYAMTIIDQVRRGDITQCSFSFRPEPPEVESEEGPDRVFTAIRTLVGFKTLYDVCAATFGAYASTSIEASE